MSDIMKNGMVVVDLMGNTSLSEMLTLDDPNEVIQDSRALLLLDKVEPLTLQGTNYSTPYATLSLLSVVNEGSGCSKQKVSKAWITSLIHLFVLYL